MLCHVQKREWRGAAHLRIVKELCLGVPRAIHSQVVLERTQVEAKDEFSVMCQSFVPRRTFYAPRSD